MVNSLRKLFVTIFFLGAFCGAFGQTITIGPVNPGAGKAYGIGSTIAVPITISDPEANIHAENRFQLWLSDENGNFNSSRAQNIGEVANVQLFYTTFLNGIIPTKYPTGANLIPGSNYRVMVKASLFSLNNNNQNIPYESPPSETFAISSATGITADLNSDHRIGGTGYPKTFGKCIGDNQFTYKFTNNSTPNASVKATIRNEFDPGRVYPSWNFTSPDQTFKADLAHYTIFQTAEMGGIVGTKAYFLINNSITLPFRSTSNPDQCVPVTREYDIDYTGLERNFPGITYSIDWNDGAPAKRTPEQMRKANGKIEHTYTVSSCNRVGVPGTPNSYKIEFLLISPFCGVANDKVLTSVIVLDAPKNEFTNPALGCVGVPVTFTNKSEAQTPRTDIQGCINTSKYDWEINGVIRPELKDLPATTNPQITFDAPGTYNIRLIFKGNTTCDPPPPATGIITIVAKPVADFSIPIKNCTNTNIAIQDLATQVRPEYSYSYSISPSTGFTFVSNTDATSKNPVLSFSNGGIYKIKQIIQIPGACSSEKEITISVNEDPKIHANWTKTFFCEAGRTIKFNSESDNVLKTSYTGTYDNTGTYLWEIQGGSFEFISSTQNSKEPTIFFKQNTKYKIKITHTNNCGTDIQERELVFVPGLKVDAGVDQTGCKGVSFNLSGTVTNGTFKRAVWSGGLGTFTPSGADPLKAVYTPHPSESGIIKLKLTVSTEEASPCDEVTDEVIVRIQAPLARFTWTKDFDCRAFNVQNIVAEAGPDNASYVWKVTRDGLTWQVGSGINFPGIRVEANQEVVVTLRVTGINAACPPEEFSHKFTTIVPEVSFKVKETVCTSEGLRVTFENTTFSKSSFSYRWNFGNGLESTLTDPPPVTFPLSTDGTDKVYPVSLGFAGPPCSTTTVIPLPQTLNITVPGSLPKLDFRADNTQGCGSLKVKFTAETQGAESYWWDFGDGSDGCNCINPTHTYAVGETPYTVRLTVKYPNGCSKTIEKTDFIKVGHMPKANFSVSPDTVLFDPNYTFTFNNRSSEQDHIRQYTWDFGDNKGTSRQESPSYTYTRSGKYTVKLTTTSLNGCIDEITKNIEIIAANDTSAIPLNLYVPNAFMPNSPSPELRVFKAMGSGVAEWRMRIFNKWGETVWETTELDASGSPSKGWDGTLNGDPVPQGVYFWEIKAKLKNGTVWPGVSYDNAAPKHVGSITLIR
mgnify:CR=1 FL=1